MSYSKKCFEKGIEILLKVEFVMQPAIDNEDTDELKKLKTYAWTLSTLLKNNLQKHQRSLLCFFAKPDLYNSIFSAFQMRCNLQSGLGYCTFLFL